MAPEEARGRAWQIFLEVFEALPRQGPGSRAATARALALCGGLPPAPRIADLGCGTGTQTLHLAELTGGRIVAVDAERRAVSRLLTRVADRGVSRRVLPVVGDMARPGLAPGEFDLVWSEGSFYNLGIAPALDVCRWLLRPGGCVAFSDAVWRTDAPPPEVKAAFADYPGMGRAEDVVARSPGAGSPHSGTSRSPTRRGGTISTRRCSIGSPTCGARTPRTPTRSTCSRGSRASRRCTVATPAATPTSSSWRAAPAPAA